MTEINFYNFINGAGLILSALGLWFTVIMPWFDQWGKRFFLSFFINFLLCCLTGLIEIALYDYPISLAAINSLSFLGTLLISLVLPMLTTYLLHCCGESVRSSRLFHAVLGLWAVFFALLATTLFSDAFYYYVPSGKQFFRGPWFPFLMLPLTAIMLLNLARTIQRRKRLSRKTYLSFLIAVLPMTATVLVHMFIDIYPLIEICIGLSVLSMYGLILSDQMEQYMRQQQEIAHQRANIMVLQMRPHFIYNAMTSIYCLCGQNPQLARQVILDFTTYLRKNFTAIASATPIPFSSELEHTRAYLAVEQAQYEGSLFVDYDTPHTSFRVPPLTLQPIVENAVKHGRDPYAGPFRISIRTRKTDSGSEIVVEDNGRGFAPDGQDALVSGQSHGGDAFATTADDSEPHIALKNIQQRLEIMCGGSLMVTPNDSGGTVVTVTIPDSKKTPDQDAAPARSEPGMQ